MSDASIVRLPFLHDHHSHVSLYAALAGLPDLEAFPGNASGREQALAVLKRLPRDGLGLVTGWHSDRLPLGRDDIKNLPPEIIVNSSLHGFLVTPAAKPYLKELWPELAERSEDESWIEHNIGPTFSFYVRLAGLDLKKLEAFMAKMEAIGIGSLDDMTIAGEEAFDLIKASRFADRIVPWATPEVYEALSPPARARCAGIKIYLDGSLGAKSASIDAPFTDGSEGSLLYTDEELMENLALVAGYKTGLSAHALGHGCIEQILRCLEALASDNVRLDSIRLEHLQFIKLDQARRCKELGIALSMQPNFNADSVDYADRLIPRHRMENDPFRMLIDEAGFVPGDDLVFGSDGMPHGPEFALQWSLFPAYESQRLYPEELVSGYRTKRERARTPQGEGHAFAIDRAKRLITRIR